MTSYASNTVRLLAKMLGRRGREHAQRGPHELSGILKIHGYLPKG